MHTLATMDSPLDIQVGGTPMRRSQPHSRPARRALGTGLAASLLALALLAGSGCSHARKAAPTSPAPTHAISGTISGAGGNGATVTLSGAASATTTANASGVYSFAGLADGAYTVTPSKATYTFTPTNRAVTMGGADVAGVDFTASAVPPPTHAISGTITGAGGNGATVTLSGAASATTTANTSGVYTFTGLADGAYTVTPSKTNYTFTPTSRSVTVSGADVAGVDFTASAVPPPTHAISGTISGAGGNGATVTLSGAASATTTANASGIYTFTGLADGAYTVTPSKTNYTFTPTSRAVTVSGADVAGVDFTASAVPPPTHAISGTISGAGGNGATVTLSGAASATTTANASGIYTFTGLADGAYTVTPSKATYTFTPTNRAVTVSGADVAGVDFTASAPPATNLTLNGATKYQLIDGMGHNINVDNWKGGQLRAGLDLLVDQNGASLLRVVRDPMDWVSSESQIPLLHSLDPATLQAVYEAPKMQDIWNTIAYLNQKGLRGAQLELNFMGWTPTWLGGSGAYGVVSNITAGKEGELATMVASLVYYGRKVKNLDFTLVAPLNEQDWNGLEGPKVGDTQYVAIIAALISELDAMGLGDVRIVGPETATYVAGYVDKMVANSAVSGRVDHLAFHSYTNSPATPGAAHAGKNYWLSETSEWCNGCDNNQPPSVGEWTFASATADLLLADLQNGFAAVMVWEGYDGFYYHHNSSSTWGQLAYDGTTYTPRKRFYTNAQLDAFIRPGMRRVSVTDTVTGLGTVVAFVDEALGKVAIVGHVTSSSPVTIQGQLTNLPFSVTSLRNVQTSQTLNLQRGADVAVTGQTFTVTIPGNTFFSLAN
jgi:O-glycosyl hydrolase